LELGSEQTAKVAEVELEVEEPAEVEAPVEVVEEVEEVEVEVAVVEVVEVVEVAAVAAVAGLPIEARRADRSRCSASSVR
jgi:hypothetical protein